MDSEREIKDQWTDAFQILSRFQTEALKRKDQGEFDDIFFTQFRHERFEDYDGTIRNFVLQAYPRPITVPLSPVVRLNTKEIKNVSDFVAAHPVIGGTSQVILFECSPKSRQSFVTPDYALAASRQLLLRHPDTCIILSSNHRIVTDDERLIDGSTVSFRENAELSKCCTLLIGCSSGISWLLTSDWAKRLPMIQLLSSESPMPNSFIHDHERNGLSTEQIIELVDCSADRLCNCVSAVFSKGFAEARDEFSQRLSLNPAYLFAMGQLLAQRRDHMALRYLQKTFRRDGASGELLLRSMWLYLRVLLGRLKRLLLRTTSSD